MVNSAGRNAIVTGAASGLGRAIAVRLAADDWRIAVADIDAAGSEETLKLVESNGGVGTIYHLDVAARSLASPWLFCSTNHDLGPAPV